MVCFLHAIRDGPFDIQGGLGCFFEKNSLFRNRSEKLFHSMCFFHLHFSDFNVFFPKKLKILLQFTFEKTNLCKKREKNNLSRGKIPASPGY